MHQTHEDRKRSSSTGIVITYTSDGVKIALLCSGLKAYLKQATSSRENHLTLRSNSHSSPVLSMLLYTCGNF
eukprot:1394901-Amorphochlora_amoeboformis.AAC.3